MAVCWLSARTCNSHPVISNGAQRSENFLSRRDSCAERSLLRCHPERSEGSAFSLLAGLTARHFERSEKSLFRTFKPSNGPLATRLP
jgi:hypothetical protein